MSNNFLGDLLLQYDDASDGRRWIVLQGFTYRLGSPDGPEFITIPRGFVTDFASMPLGIVFKSPGGKWDKPAVVHDALYKLGLVFRDDGPTRFVTRGEADDIFREAMGVAGVNRVAKWIIYRGVRLGGWRAWAQHRRAEQESVDVEASR